MSNNQVATVIHNSEKEKNKDNVIDLYRELDKKIDEVMSRLEQKKKKISRK